MNLPITLKAVGATDPSRVMITAEKACAPGESICDMLRDVTPAQLYNAVLAADAIGTKFLGE